MMGEELGKLESSEYTEVCSLKRGGCVIYSVKCEHSYQLNIYSVIPNHRMSSRIGIVSVAFRL